MSLSFAMPISTRTFRNGRSSAVRIPAEFGIGPGEDVVLSQDADGTVRITRGRPFAGFFSAVERMRAEGNDPARDEPLEIPRMGAPRELDLRSRPAGSRGGRTRRSKR